MLYDLASLKVGVKYFTILGETVILVIDESTSPIVLKSCECLNTASNFVNSVVLKLVSAVVTSVTKVSFVLVVVKELNLKLVVKNK